MRVRRALVLLAVAGGLVLAGLVTAPLASAHATLTSSTPADGAALATAPAQVSLTFDEAVGLDPGYVRVVDGAGTSVTTGNATHAPGDSKTVTVALRNGLTDPAGYLVSYRVVSADGHPVAGTVSFTVGGGAPVTASGTSGGSSALVEGFLDAGAAIAFVGLAAAGGAWLVVSRRAGVLDSRTVRWVVRGGLLLGIAGTLVQLLLQGPYVAGAGATVSAWTLLGDTLTSPFGVAHLVELGALLVLLVLSRPIARMRGPLHRAQLAVVAVAAVVWLAALTALAASGHARVRSPAWLGLPSTVVHLVAVTTWVGGLLVLLAVVVRRPDDAAVVLVRRLSAVALWCVVAVAVTGVVQAWLETSSWAALVETTYGALVITKSALFLVLLGLGALARRYLRGADPVRRVRRSTVVEALVMASVLAVTSVLVSEPPARTAYAADLATRPAHATLDFDDQRSADLTVTPAAQGPVAVQVVLHGVAEVDTLRMTATQSAANVGPITVDLDWQGGPLFTADGVLLPVSGRWTFEVTLQTGRFDAVVADATVTVA